MLEVLLSTFRTGVLTAAVNAGPARHGGVPVQENAANSFRLPAAKDKGTPALACPEPTVASSAPINGTEE